MTIIEKAHELGQLIKDSDELKALKDAESAQQTDEEAQKKVSEFNIMRMNLAKDLQEGKITQEEAIEKNKKAFDEMVASCQVIKDYVDAKTAFDKVVNSVNNIINIYIMGEQDGCTHDCSTCGGCH